MNLVKQWLRKHKRLLRHAAILFVVDLVAIAAVNLIHFLLMTGLKLVA